MVRMMHRAAVWLYHGNAPVKEKKPIPKARTHSNLFWRNVQKPATAKTSSSAPNRSCSSMPCRRSVETLEPVKVRPWSKRENRPLRPKTAPTGNRLEKQKQHLLLANNKF